MPGSRSRSSSFVNVIPIAFAVCSTSLSALGIGRLHVGTRTSALQREVKGQNPKKINPGKKRQAAVRDVRTLLASVED